MEREHLIVWFDVVQRAASPAQSASHTDPGLYSGCQGGSISAVQCLSLAHPRAAPMGVLWAPPSCLLSSA